MPLPAWSAAIVQVPAARSVILFPFLPLDVQTDGVVVVNVTTRPEDAVALTLNGDWASVRFLSAPKSIV